jgi:bacterioferritin-associated ferredoxin
MENTSSPNCTHECSQRLVCHCFQVTEAQLVTALTVLELRTVREIRQKTGAGDGCTACHHALRKYLERHHHPAASADLAAAI